MKLAKSVRCAIACGAAAFGLAGTALAGEGGFGMNDSRSSSEPAMPREEAFILLEPVDVAYIYEIDEDRDGVSDGYLILEESDTLARSGGEDFEPPMGG